MSKYSKLTTQWYAHLTDPDAANKFKELLYNKHNDLALTRLKEIVEKKRESLEASERGTEMYQSSSWAYMQAHNNGARQMLKYIEDLLAFVDDTKTKE